MNKIVISVTHLKNIIQMAEENAMKDSNLSPLISIELIEKEVYPGNPDKIRICQLPYGNNGSPLLIGY